MWSPFYDYYEIRKNKNYSESIDNQKIESIISNFSIRDKGHLCYKNNEGNPWFSLTLIHTENGMHAVDENTVFGKINLINIITSKQNDSNKDYYLNLLRSISKKLNWEIILEEDDDENENVVIL